MVHPYSYRISRVPHYLSSTLVLHMAFRVQGSHSLWLTFPCNSTIPYHNSRQATPISLTTTLGISFDFYSCSYLDVSVHRVRSVHTNVTQKCNTIAQQCILNAYTRFPHSDIVDYHALCQLIYAFRRLTRPSSPLIA